MKTNNANEERLIANEIMRRLYEADEREQLDLLRRYAEIAIKHIDERRREAKAIRRRP